MYKNHSKSKVGHLLAFALLISFILFPNTLFAASANEGKKLVAKKCVSCHRFEGEAKSRFDLRAPDLMWGGNKYQVVGLRTFFKAKKNRFTRKTTVGINLENPKSISCFQKRMLGQLLNISPKI